MILGLKERLMEFVVKMWAQTWVKLGLFVLLLTLISVFSISIPLDDKAYSKVLFSDDGQLLSAKVADDEQWRFPNEEQIPDGLKEAILAFEDDYFHLHPGFNPISILKSIYVNWQSGRVVRGGSTITMQLVRMARGTKHRTYGQKIIEILGAVQLELRFSKQEILAKWCQLASFGGNVVGAETAAWRYYGRPLSEMSLAEYATLAVLPNAPALIHPNRNRSQLKEKRNMLLAKLVEKGSLSLDELELFQEEDIPNRLRALPQNAMHLLNAFIKEFPNQNRFISYIDRPIQQKLESFLKFKLEELDKEGVHAISVVVIDVQTNKLVSYIGNLPLNGQQRYVNLAQAPRSYGSLLKPFLYAYSLDKGFYMPDELVADIPTVIDGYRTQNFDKQYRGAVPFGNMVSQSLNIPAIRALKKVGLHEFYEHLEQLNLSHIDKGANHYGLSLILGGAESDLWSLTTAFNGLARRHLNYAYPFNKATRMKDEQEMKIDFSVGDFAIHHTINAMSEVVRPREEQGWKKLLSNHRVAWKTGTSYGHKDAWTIGFDQKYTVGVWVGNENGEGRDGLVGIQAAAPIFFEVLKLLPHWEGLSSSYKGSSTVKLCRESGKLAGLSCPEVERLKVDTESHNWQACNYHPMGQVQHGDSFYPVSCLERGSEVDTFFQLPSIQEYYYRQVNTNYYVLPPIDGACNESESNQLDFIYPLNGMIISLPLESNGVRRKMIAEMTFPSNGDKIYWFLDDQFIHTSQGENKLGLDVERGKHTLLLVSEKGERRSVKFRVEFPQG